jgi:hypothetical protein
MNEIHDLGTPRNLYEKLLRDNEKLDTEIDGDNVFNFVSTAFHLQHWIKNSPLISSEVVKRILRRISNDQYIKHCQNIARAKEHFKVEVDVEGNASMAIGDEEIDVNDFRNEIVGLYGNYFNLK